MGEIRSHPCTVAKYGKNMGDRVVEAQCTEIVN